jgi:hypothetical protein
MEAAKGKPSAGSLCDREEILNGKRKEVCKREMPLHGS